MDVSTRCDRLLMAAASGPRGVNASSSPLSDRYRRLLALLVREYIDHGEPVSSLWLAAHSGAGVSSATVRNMLARLEEDGYLHQPHTSAGRVPTDRAYRSYVDMLLEARRRTRPAADVEARLRRAGTVESVLDDGSHELSRASSHLGFALPPANASTKLRRIDFVSLDGTKVMVVVVSQAGHVAHKLVELAERLSPDELVQAANYLNEQFHGLALAEIRARVIERLTEDRTLYDALLSRTLQLAKSSLDDDLTAPTPLFVHGASSLLHSSFGDVDEVAIATLRTLLVMIEEKHRLVHVLTEYIDGTGLTIVIGREHSSPDLKQFSLVATTYTDGESTGTIGVIGPTRMRYSRAIAAVDSVSQAITRVLVGDSH